MQLLKREVHAKRWCRPPPAAAPSSSSAPTRRRTPHPPEGTPVRLRQLLHRADGAGAVRRNLRPRRLQDSWASRRSSGPISTACEDSEHHATKKWMVPGKCGVGEAVVKPLRGGEALVWQIQQMTLPWHQAIFVRMNYAPPATLCSGRCGRVPSGLLCT